MTGGASLKPRPVAAEVVMDQRGRGERFVVINDHYDKEKGKHRDQGDDRGKGRTKGDKKEKKERHEKGKGHGKAHDDQRPTEGYRGEGKGPGMSEERFCFPAAFLLFLYFFRSTDRRDSSSFLSSSP